MEEGLLSLKWNNHKPAFLNLLSILREKGSFTDAIIMCGKKFFNVHKLVLMACSDFFCDIFDQLSCQKPVIVLSGMSNCEVEALLDYMYLGEVDVPQTSLPNLIKAAESLRIKGLAVSDADLLPGFHKVKSPKRPLGHLNSSDKNSDSGINKESTTHILKRRKMFEEGNCTTDSKNEEITIKSEDSESTGNNFLTDRTIDEFLTKQNENASIDCINEAGPSGLTEGELQDNPNDNGLEFDMNQSNAFLPTVSLIENEKVNCDMQNLSYNSENLFLQGQAYGEETSAPFTCIYCLRSFSDRYKRDRHTRIHTGEKPFQCPFCQYKASRKDPVVRHMKLIHLEKVLNMASSFA